MHRFFGAFSLLNYTASDDQITVIHNGRLTLGGGSLRCIEGERYLVVTRLLCKCRALRLTISYLRLNANLTLDFVKRNKIYIANNNLGFEKLIFVSKRYRVILGILFCDKICLFIEMPSPLR